MDAPLKLLQDPVWQFIGAVIAVLGITVTIVIFFNQRGNKKIAYSVISDAPVASIEKGVEDIGEVEVFYKTKDGSKLIKDAHLLIIELWNAGNKEIKREDFEGKIRFEFGSTANILTTAILDTDPPDIKGMVIPEIEQKNVLLLEPLLLNKNDRVKMKVLVDGYQAGSLKAHSRIAGVKQLEEVVIYENTVSDENPNFFTGCGIFWFLLFVLSPLLYAILYAIISAINAIFNTGINMNNNDSLTGAFLLFLLVILLILTLTIVRILKQRYKRKKAITK